MVLAGGEAGGYFELFLKYGQPPGWHYGEYDFRQAYNYYSSQDTKDQEIKFDSDSDDFQTGAHDTMHCLLCSLRPPPISIQA